MEPVIQQASMIPFHGFIINKKSQNAWLMTTMFRLCQSYVLGLRDCNECLVVFSSVV